ncbi:MAG TPA: hypothetical protein VNO30_20885 [Kofleriaceae bacterium]|nr:hypothetical protein [Kofleriaceae bacterium]
MSKTYITRSVLLGLSFLMTLGSACVDDRSSAPEADDALANRVHQPFYVAVFDHAPDEAEIQADFERFLLASGKTGTSATHDPGPRQTPQQGQKLVRIAATTGTGESAGTSQAGLFKFKGTWECDGGGTFSEEFVLNNLNEDDLDRDTVSIFHYPPFPAPCVRDRFLRGKILTLSEDGWYCVALDLSETNYLWITRNQHLPFDQRIDYPFDTPSDSKPATDSSWLSYY